MHKEEAANILGVTTSNINPFSKVDPWNGFNVEGFMAVSEHHYGSMVITKIDNYLTEQMVYSTPKFKYPFDRNGIYKFPEARFINVYEKLDGTNVVAYSYTLKHKKYLAYKTRLTPFLQESRWGSFRDMWSKVLLDHPSLEDHIRKYVFDKHINLSFEMFGYLNEHLIRYDDPLDTRILFGIDQKTGDVIDLMDLNFPMLNVFKEVTITNCKDLYSWYQKHKNEQELKNKLQDDGSIEGSEGFIWYLHGTDGNLYTYKNKPPSVEEIHFHQADGSRIHKHTILTTIQNAYESVDEVSYEIVKDLLMEEYDQRVIEAYKDSIIHAIQGIQANIEFRERVMELYKEKHLDINMDKAGTMRFLSGYFQPKDMKKVYTALKIMLDK